MVIRAAFAFREKKRQKRKGVHSKNASGPNRYGKSQNGYKKKYRGQGRS